MVAAATAVLLGVAGCAPSEAVSTPTASGAGTLPFAHIHGVGFDPGDGDLLVATHDGLFVVDEEGDSGGRSDGRGGAAFEGGPGEHRRSRHVAAGCRGRCARAGGGRWLCR